MSINKKDELADFYKKLNAVRRAVRKRTIQRVIKIR
jgi:hypothetical protein